MHTLKEYQLQFANWFGAERAFAFWKGRVALYAILKAMGVGRGDEVIVPGYTCVMDVNPIKYLGAKPVYVDIEPNTFNIDPGLLEEKITSRTKVIIAQHTYGYVCDMDALMGIADRRNIPVLEDCCLAIGSKYRGRLAGTFGRAAYFSFQWNKPYTTGLGGMAILNDSQLADKMHTLVTGSARQPGLAEVLLLWAQFCVYRALVYPRTTALAQTLFRYLTKKAVVIGSSSSHEFLPVMGDDFFKRMSTFQAHSGMRQLAVLGNSIEHRRAMASLYDDLLSEKGWRVRQYDRQLMEPVMVRYPVRVTEKKRALQEAASRGVEIGSWFESPLHPEETPLEPYDYKWGMCPQAEKASKEVVNLPVHMRAGKNTCRRTVEFITSFVQAD